PSGVCYWHWATSGDGPTALLVLVGIFMFIMVLIVFRLAFTTLGFIGVTASLLLIAAGIMVQLGLGWLRFADLEITEMTLLFWISTILAGWLSWSLIQKNLTGERDIIRYPP